MIINQENGGTRRIIKEDGVIYQVLAVHRNGLAADSRPRIQIVGDWLPELGFANGALVQSLPEPDGLVLTPYNENINYSELYNSTKEKGGALNRLYISNTVTTKGPTFVTTGQHLLSGGLKIGDACVAKCEYGRIRIRKVKGNVRLINACRTKRKTETCAPSSMVRMLGEWLNEIGFTRDTLMTVAAEPGRITFTAHSQAIVYSEIVKIARKNKMQLVQVSTIRGNAPLIQLTGRRITTAGFDVGDIFTADYEYGTIKLQKFDPQRFGFPEAESPGN